MRASRWGSAWCWALLGLPLSAWATLGGNAASIDADRTALGAAVQAGASASGTAAGAPAMSGMAAGNGTGTPAAAAPGALPGTTVETMTLASGTVVREYLSSSTGVVFAVAWQGPVLPQLKLLLGADHFNQYTQAVSAARASGGQGAAGVSLPGLVVNSTGHMGAFFGRAWLPPLLPAGVTAHDIQ